MGECEAEYSTYSDGAYTHVVSLDESVRSIKAHIRSVEMRNKYLEEENARLKDEAYKDTQLQEMRESMERMRQEIRYGFPVDEEEHRRLEEWKRKHDEEAHGADYSQKKFRYSGAIGGSYTYRFTPTSIGTFGTCVCSCGAKFDFQEA